MPPQRGSGDGFQGLIEAERDTVERAFSEESRGQRIQAAADSHCELEHLSFRTVKLKEDFSRLPSE